MMKANQIDNSVKKAKGDAIESKNINQITHYKERKEYRLVSLANDNEYKTQLAGRRKQFMEE